MTVDRYVAAFQQLEFSSPIGEISNVSYLIANWLAGGMMVRMHSIPIFVRNFLIHSGQIYRYLVIFRSSSQFPFWVVMLLPILGYMGSFCTFPLRSGGLSLSDI
jgi:hypothetical protein